MADFGKLEWFKYLSQPADLLPQHVELIGKEQKGCRLVVKNYLEFCFPRFITSRVIRLLPNYAQRQRKNIVSAADINKMKTSPSNKFYPQKNTTHNWNPEPQSSRRRGCVGLKGTRQRSEHRYELCLCTQSLKLVSPVAKTTVNSSYSAFQITSDTRGGEALWSDSLEEHSFILCLQGWATALEKFWGLAVVNLIKSFAIELYLEIMRCVLPAW